jgi:transcriptional regulator with GAF, ATPase, and Fis domain
MMDVFEHIVELVPPYPPDLGAALLDPALPFIEAVLLRIESDSPSEPGAASAIAASRKALPGVPIIAAIPHHSESAARTWRAHGAAEVVTHDLDPEELRLILQRTRTVPAWRRSIVGNCGPIRRVAETISLIAARRSTILITGETGTGKEVIARAIHQASGRTGPLVSVNCTALPEALMEAELFGHTKGAFTGANTARAGRFEAAQRGTIFLDEIGDMPLELQSKLLRVLQEREIQRLGSSESIPIDVRVVAATNADLMSKVEDGRFRQDLFFRLNVVPVHLPPLRERGADLLVLAWHFVRKICRQEGIPLKVITPGAQQALEHHPWPGNIRELENSIERAIALSGHRHEILDTDLMIADSKRISLDPNAEISVPETGIDFEQIVARIERSMIEQALRRTNGNKSQAADLLRLKRTTLGAKLRTLGGFPIPQKLSA